MKTKFPRAAAAAVAEELVARLGRCAERIEIAGSLRRRKEEVGDIELVYVPRLEARPDGEDLFRRPRTVNLADEALDRLLRIGVLAKRLNVERNTTWGRKNKLAAHVATGVPVDLFATAKGCWWNYLVCRTGGKANNMEIASAARRKGWRWHPMGPGFTDERGQWVFVESEREVFAFVGLAYKEPWERA